MHRAANFDAALPSLPDFMSLATLAGTLHRGCGGRYALQQEAVTMRLSGMSAEVTREFYSCDKCGHEQRTIDQRDTAEKAAIEQIREKHQLLMPRAIRQLRESLGLTLPQFAELCYGTPKGIVEGWEKGRYLQNREADQLIRSLADRETLELRAAKAGVTLPVAPGAAEPPAPSATPPESGAAAADSPTSTE
jgi:putative zinc finger/helix-turn-helix YgiT family protein